MKKMMMILAAVAAIGFTACNKTNTEEQKAQTEQTAEGQTVEENANATTEQDGAKADEGTATEEKVEANAEEKKEENK